MKSKLTGRVLISDANSRRSLTAVRALGQRGLTVVAGHDQTSALVFSSKFCRERLLYPSPVRSPLQFVDYILKHLRSTRYDCFIPMSDEVIKLVVRHKEAISALTNILVVDSGTLDLALDKRLTIQFARQHGFAHPKTYAPESLQAVESLCDQIPYPAVIKPRIGSGSKGIFFVEKPEDLLVQYRRVHQRYHLPLIQEGIPPSSSKFGVQCLFNHQGHLRAAVVQRFCRQFPSSGGPGSCFETVERPDIMAQGVRLLKKLKWRGVAQVEYLEDERDGVLKLMEINPRFWDSLQTVIQAGVDFPHLLYQISTEGDVDPELEYRSGEICRSMLPGEILYFLANFKHLRTDPSFWKFRGSNLGYCILNRKDVRPAFAFFGIAIKSLFDRDVRDTVFHRI